jgi:hypothetical protein
MILLLLKSLYPATSKRRKTTLKLKSYLRKLSTEEARKRRRRVVAKRRKRRRLKIKSLSLK